MLTESFDGEEDLQILWAYQGSSGGAQAWQDELGLTHTVLIDSDRSLKSDYFIANGPDVFASNPRHFVIDRSGVLAHIATTVSPTELEAAIRAALDADPAR